MDVFSHALLFRLLMLEVENEPSSLGVQLPPLFFFWEGGGGGVPFVKALPK